MKIAATHALADLAKEPVPYQVMQAYRVDHLQFGPEYIIPKPFDPRVLIWVVPTTDKERAIKVANEKRAIILANEAWGDHEATLALFEPVATGGKDAER